MVILPLISFLVLIRAEGLGGGLFDLITEHCVWGH